MNHHLACLRKQENACLDSRDATMNWRNIGKDDSPKIFDVDAFLRSAAGLICWSDSRDLVYKAR